MVEGDADLAVYQHTAEIFGGDEFLFLTFEPHNGQPIEASSLAILEQLSAEISVLDGVAGVFSVLDAPLLKSPPVTLADLEHGFPTLRHDSIDFALAADELSASPFFSELLVSKNGRSTALKIDLAAHKGLLAATAQRDALQEQGIVEGGEWQEVNHSFRLQREAFLAHRELLINQIRDIQHRFEKFGTLYLGGVPMIAADMIAYVKRDLSVFGGTVIGLMVIALAIFFRSVRWVILPIATAALSVVYTVGFLGYLDWQATAVSSNFISLLGITAISLTIHLVVHYRELQLTQPDMEKVALVYNTMREKFAPCLFTAVTTMAAFGSLTASGILPVEYFGWMMCIGIVISFIATYTFFPAVLLLLGPNIPSSTAGNTNNFIRALGEFTRWRPGLIVALGAVLSVVAVVGVQKVSLDNRFVDYFDPQTEINQGMRYIDEQLGGTIPFDVVLSFPPYEEEVFDEDDDFGFDEEDDAFPERYWFSRSMLDRLEKVHRFLDAQPQVGKVLSLTSLEDFALEFTGGEKLSSFEIVAILGAVPLELQKEIITPYAAPRDGLLRLSGRIIEGAQSFDREEFRQQIIEFGGQETSFRDDEIAVTGMMVLFNNMLKQLLSSQINTLSYVLLAVFVMFLLLLRSLRHALLGMIPNTLAAALVIAAMGYAGIPLDMMTTTIAAICVGIGVDDTIHYLHRFRLEYDRWGDARVAVSFAHASIGRALFYTSITVMVGFSVLYFSNFVPTVRFGLWTAAAMGLALIANLVLLPALLVMTHGSKTPDPTVRTDLAF